MNGLKAIMIVSTIIAAAAVLSACEKGYNAALQQSGAGTAAALQRAAP